MEKEQPHSDEDSQNSHLATGGATLKQKRAMARPVQKYFLLYQRLFSTKTALIRSKLNASRCFVTKICIWPAQSFSLSSATAPCVAIAAHMLVKRTMPTCKWLNAAKIRISWKFCVKYTFFVHNQTQKENVWSNVQEAVFSAHVRIFIRSS
jgi:hypothetical protein